MAEVPQTPDGVEAMALQLVLHKLQTLEQALQRIPPLLTKIVEHLEAQKTQPPVPMASYADLYPELAPDATDDLAPRGTEMAVPNVHPPSPPRLHGWRRWLFWEER